MKVGFVKTIAALLVGAGIASAQSQGSHPGKMTPRGTVLPAQAEDSHPAMTGQHPYSESPATDPPSGFEGVNWNEGGAGSYRVYTDAEYLLWNIHNTSLPPLATSVPVGLVLVNQNDLFVGPGAVGTNPNPVVNTFSVPFSVTSNPTFPNSNSIENGEHNGARITVGAWFDGEEDLGIEASAFWLEKLSNQFRNTTANTLNQFNLQTGLADRTFFVPVGMPPQLSSQGLTVFPAQSTSEVFGTLATEMWGAEVNLRSSGCRVGSFTFGALAGVRYLHFEDTFTLANNVSVTDAPQSPVQAPFLPITFSTFDRIKTHNEIFAPQVGLEAEGKCYGFFVSGRGQFAIGPNFQEVNVQGKTSVSGSGNPLMNAPGGLLSGPSNQGDHSRTRITVLPELNAKVGYEFGSWLRIHAGYDAMFLSHIARPAQQVGFTTLATTVSVAGSTNSMNITQPVINLHDDKTWVEGLNLGVEFRY